MTTDVLTALQEMIGALVTYPVVIGSIPPVNGFAISFVGGAPQETYRDFGMNIPLPVLFNGKGEDQQDIADQMNAVHKALTTAKNLPYSTDWQIYAIRTTSFPNLIGREENKNWVYGSSFSIDYYSKGAE